MVFSARLSVDTETCEPGIDLLHMTSIRSIWRTTSNFPCSTEQRSSRGLYGLVRADVIMNYHVIRGINTFSEDTIPSASDFSSRFSLKKGFRTKSQFLVLSVFWQSSAFKFFTMLIENCLRGSIFDAHDIALL